jgi:phospholipid transport system transporter-binding protein
VSGPKARLEALGGGRFRVSGIVDGTTAGDLLTQGVARFDAEPRIDVDLGGVTESDSAGLALLIEWLRYAANAGKEIHFANIPGQIAALARISEVEDLIATGTTAKRPEAAAA